MSSFPVHLRRSLAVASILAFGCGGGTVSQQAPTTSSHYVMARDGVRIAVDVNLPEGATAGSTYPALLELTRYGRSREDPQTRDPIPSLSPLDRYFLGHGYAVVKVDARGSGASFGTRPVEYGPEEVRDGYDVVQWVTEQPWSDGSVGAYGTSYSGTTAELLAAVNHPAVKAVIPGWSDFETYESPARPYGLVASAFIGTWSRIVGWMDENNVEALGASIRRVDQDTDGSLLAQALEDHEANPEVSVGVGAAEFKDDTVGGGYTWEQASPVYWRSEIERSGVPMLVPVSWMDAGTAEGALLRFRYFSNPQHLVIMATSHGGGSHASPYLVEDQVIPPEPSLDRQFELRRAFFDHHIRGADNEVGQWPPIRFWNLGEEAFHDTDSWPPSGTRTRDFYLGPNGSLEMGAVPTGSGTDTYEVDPEVTTGSNNRWMTQMGEPVLGLHDRGDMDARMLTYTTPPLDVDLQIAGTPTVTLHLASDREDGVVYAYLEDVGPDGRSVYITEGGLRLIHRRTSPNPQFPGDVPYHTFHRADAAPMPPGQPQVVAFQLQPIAALIRAGHRIRLAIAGADAGTFDPLPADGVATLGLHRGSDAPSSLQLPVVDGGLRR